MKFRVKLIQTIERSAVVEVEAETLEKAFSAAKEEGRLNDSVAWSEDYDRTTAGVG